MTELSNHPAEEFLIEQGIVARPTDERRRVLACMACQWSKTGKEDPLQAKAYVGNLIYCSKVNENSVYTHIRKLQKSGVISTHQEPALPYPSRKICLPMDTEVGLQFLDALEPPEACPQKTDDQ